MPFAVILGKSELDAGKVKIKELGLAEGHPEKNGVDVDLTALVSELKQRIATLEARSQTRTNGATNGVDDVTQAVQSVSV